MAELIINRNNFEQEVLQAKIPVVIDFWAPWCGPCQMMGPVIEELAAKADGKFIVGKINVDEEAELAGQYGIMSIPSIKVFDNGQVVASSIGVTSQDKILEMIP